MGARLSEGSWRRSNWPGWGLDDCCHVTSASKTLRLWLLLQELSAHQVITLRFIRIVTTFCPTFGLSRLCWHVRPTNSISTTNNPIVINSRSWYNGWLSCLQHGVKWCCYTTKTFDDTPVEIAKADDNLYVSYWLRFKPLLDSVNSFLFYLNTIPGDDKAKESELIFIEMAFLQICIKAIFPEDFQNLSNGFDVWIFGIDKNIIQIYDGKDIKLLS